MSKRGHVFSFFSGLGFLDLGFEKEGFDVVHVNEFHEPFLEAYKHSRKRMGIPAPKYGYHLGSIEDALSKFEGGMNNPAFEMFFSLVSGVSII